MRSILTLGDSQDPDKEGKFVESFSPLISEGPVLARSTRLETAEWQVECQVGPRAEPLSLAKAWRQEMECIVFSPAVKNRLGSCRS